MSATSHIYSIIHISQAGFCLTPYFFQIKKKKSFSLHELWEYTIVLSHVNLNVANQKHRSLLPFSFLIK